MEVTNLAIWDKDFCFGIESTTQAGTERSLHIAVKKLS